MLALDLFFSREKENALLIARGAEAVLLEKEINENPRYNFRIIQRIDTEEHGLDFNKDVLEKISNEKVKILIVDSVDQKISAFLPNFYDLIFSRITFLEMHDLYEEVFDRVPISLLDYSWFLEHISATPREVYDILKRLMDIFISIPLLLISLFFYPFIYVAELFEGNRTLFSFQERVGQFGKKIRLIKFRTMLFDDNGEWKGEKQNKVTRVGKFLRMSRFDELPQLWNVLRGDISLIGPRPEFPKAVSEYELQIPYYGVRHIIKPGLSGWAQIYGEHPHHGIGVAETKNKLSYDLFYIKRRSLLLDLIIALKTIKTLLSRQGI
ncbi:MAG: sugar transferase [bacterium]